MAHEYQKELYPNLQASEVNCLSYHRSATNPMENIANPSFLGTKIIISHGFCIFSPWFQGPPHEAQASRRPPAGPGKSTGKSMEKPGPNWKIRGKIMEIPPQIFAP